MKKPLAARRLEIGQPAKSSKDNLQGVLIAQRVNGMRVPRAKDLAELNAYLLACSRQDEQRVIGDRAQAVGAGMVMEREHLRPLEGSDDARRPEMWPNPEAPTQFGIMVHILGHTRR